MRVRSSEDAVFAALDRFAGNDGTTTATVPDIAAVTGVHTNTVFRALRRLVEGGRIHRQQVIGDGHGPAFLTTVIR